MYARAALNTDIMIRAGVLRTMRYLSITRRINLSMVKMIDILQVVDIATRKLLPLRCLFLRGESSRPHLSLSGLSYGEKVYFVQDLKV